MDHYPNYNTSAGVFTPDNLIAGHFPIKTKVVTLKAGAAFKRGDILAAEVTGDGETGISETGKFVLVTADADARYLLAEDRDATDVDATAVAYVTGEFNINSVRVGAGATAAGCAAALEPRSIFLLSAVA